MTTSKSPLAVAYAAFIVGKGAFSLWSHERSPHTFTQPQLFACLVLKEFFTTDYRGIAAILQDSSDMRRILELNKVPHFTTLQKAAHRLLKQPPVRRLMKKSLELAERQRIKSKKVSLAALDGTGFESHHVSKYFVERKEQTSKPLHYQRFPKAGIICDTNNHLILCGIPQRGPKFDYDHFDPALKEATRQTKIKDLVADAMYDGEPRHVLARGIYGIRTIIPAARWRKGAQLPKGKYRKIMATRFNTRLYGQRWQVETVISMLKRHLGSFLRARTYFTQCREIMLRLLTHNIMIVQ